MTAALIICWLCIAIVVYAYIGYPILVAALARIRPMPTWPQSAPPSVTLVITAFNEEAVLRQKIENALQLEYADPQIIVATDGSSDGSVAIVQSFAPNNVVLSHDERRAGKAAAMMRAATQAEGDVIVFSDANNMFEPDALTQIVRPFADERVGMATGAKVSGGDGGVASSEQTYWKYEAAIRKAETRFGNCTAVSGELLAVRRSVLPDMPEGIVNDDFYLAMKVLRNGYRVVYVPEAKSFESASLNAADERTRRSRMTAGRWQAIAMSRSLLPWRRPLLVWQVVSHKYLRLLLPFAMFGALAANIVAVMLGAERGAQALLGLQLLFYGLAVVALAVRIPGIIGKLLYIPRFLVASNWASARGLWSYLRNPNLHLWQRVERVEGRPSA